MGWKSDIAIEWIMGGFLI